ncbi:Phosphoglucosamine mutase [Desulfurella amilsii]|uniref:Phosphoglucosamine mutase n=1 Tax=Desulfurella amilsii TaxID=1562698 RepID=A0A1X4XVY6_9BACT|nr:phosphoglucosamine mutase [Desulfurella amilsii]OSS41685.1 Phosphoglucosamine mutase [Desulfurella amilsii]
MKIFGTDGIRGKANVFPLVGDLAYKLGRALVYALDSQKNKKKKIIIGKDTRISGYMLESAITSGIVSMGADAYLVGPMPTPAIAFLVKSMRADAGVVISASHNPFDDNGIKIFSHEGIKIPVELEDLIESYTLSDTLDNIKFLGANIGKVYRIRDTLGRYIVFAKNVFPYNLELDGIRIVIDCANGATYKVAPMVFEELGAEVIVINNEPNGININEKCGSTYPNNIIEKTTLFRADVGIAFDGDGDRVIMVDENGKLIDGDAILSILAIGLKNKGKLKNNTVVGTIMSNFGLEHILKQNGILLERVDVGDKYIIQKMIEKGYNLGGEPSGHVVLSDFNTTGDGIITALAVLSIMVEKSVKLSSLFQSFIKVPEKTKNVHVSKKINLDEIDEIQQAIEHVKDKLNGQGRLVVRYSGTEPVVRITIESKDINIINDGIGLISKTIEKHLS